MRNTNTNTINKDLNWLQAIIIERIKVHLDKEKNLIYNHPVAPDLRKTDTFYANFVNKYKLTESERIVVLLAMAVEIRPELLDCFLVRSNIFDKNLSVLGGNISANMTFNPTIMTALFLLAGDNFDKQLEYLDLFEQSAKLIKHILKPSSSETDVPLNASPLRITQNALHSILSGRDLQYEYSSEFPARELTTLMEWDDLILSESTNNDLKELLAWPDYGQRLLDELNLNKNIQKGYRTLFYGPSGTGKTLTASLIGKKVGKPVYRIDLSQLVSKYIGETEKNLEKIFTASEHQDWILFFDEADALFGKRTSIGSSNDRFANQETAYLLQRIEASDNLVILATNLKGNIDQAFSRRFQSIIHFPMPGSEQRLQLWNNIFGDRVVLDDAIDLSMIAEKCDIAGGSIVNVVRYATLMSISNERIFVGYNDFIDGLRREYKKLGRSLVL